MLFPHRSKTLENESQEIEKLTKDYLDSGGQIEEVAQGDGRDKESINNMINRFKGRWNYIENL